MVVDDSLKQSTAAVRCSLQQPGNSKGNHERPQKWHRLSTDPLTVTPRLADKKPISVTTGDARATFSLRYDEKDSRAGVQLSTCVETQVCVYRARCELSHLLTLMVFINLSCRPQNVYCNKNVSS
ncbi:TPA: hypothetical protein ACH3X2_014143 [Trebouxia sp. C0005]